jgi:hypothetical protein
MAQQGITNDPQTDANVIYEPVSKMSRKVANLSEINHRVP